MKTTIYVVTVTEGNEVYFQNFGNAESYVENGFIDAEPLPLEVNEDRFFEMVEANMLHDAKYGENINPIWEDEEEDEEPAQEKEDASEIKSFIPVILPTDLNKLKKPELIEKIELLNGKLKYLQNPQPEKKKLTFAQVKAIFNKNNELSSLLSTYYANLEFLQMLNLRADDSILKSSGRYTLVFEDNGRQILKISNIEILEIFKLQVLQLLNKRIIEVNQEIEALNTI